MKSRTAILSMMVIMIMVLSTIQLTTPVSAITDGAEIHITESGTYDLSGHDTISAITTFTDGPVVIENINANLTSDAYMDWRSPDISIINSHFNVTNDNTGSEFVIYRSLKASFVNTTFTLTNIDNFKIRAVPTRSPDNLILDNVTVTSGRLNIYDTAHTSIVNSNFDLFETPWGIGSISMINNTFSDIFLRSIESFELINNTINLERRSSYSYFIVELSAVNNGTISGNTIYSEKYLPGLRLISSTNVTVSNNTLQLGSVSVPDRAEINHAIELKYSNNITISNNTIDTHAKPILILESNDIDIVDNSVETNGWTAIEVGHGYQEVSDIYILRNYLKSSGVVISLNKMSGVIMNNTITNGGRYRFAIYTEDHGSLSVINNTITNGDDELVHIPSTNSNLIIMEDNTLILIDKQINPIHIHGIIGVTENISSTYTLQIDEVHPDKLIFKIDGTVHHTIDIASNIVGDELTFTLPALPSGVYTYELFVNDTYGNEFTTEGTIESTPDDTPPTIRFWISDEYDWPSSTIKRIRIYATDENNYTLDVYFNGKLYANDEPDSVYIELSSYNPGSYHLRAIATDIMNNSVEETREFTIKKDTYTPDIIFEEDEGFIYNSNNHTISYSFRIFDYTYDKGTIEILSYGQVIHSTNYTTPDFPDEGVYVAEGNIDVPDDLEGTHVFTITVTDISDNSNSTEIEIDLPLIETTNSTNPVEPTDESGLAGITLVQTMMIAAMISGMIRKVRKYQN